MCSYNLVNGVYACENAHLLNDVLKGDWQFPGFVMSDWGATHSTAAAAVAGLDQEQPDNYYFGSLAQAVASGQVPQSRVDDMVHRILRAMYAVGLFDYPEQLTAIDTAADQAIAQEAEEQGAVLLKNAGGQLPLNAATVQVHRGDRVARGCGGALRRRFGAGDAYRRPGAYGRLSMPAVLVAR